MSSFKNFASMLNDLQLQADGRGTLDGSAIEDFLSIAGYEQEGGGGGGDFTTATVTVINQTENYPSISMPVAQPQDGDDPPMALSVVEPTANATTTYSVILYKGRAVVVDYDRAINSVTGDIEYNDGEGIITGDCTLNIDTPS